MTWFLIIFTCLLFALLALLVWLLRPNQAQVAAMLKVETKEIVNNGRHNGFTDLIYWKNSFFLVYISSPSHFASNRSRVVVLCSKDTVKWDEIASLRFADKDIRDPKLAAIGGDLFLFAVLNASFDPQPYRTVVTKSSDGIQWSPFKEIQPDGWIFGRPKSLDGENWFVPAHWREFNKVALFQSQDGENWSLCSAIVEKSGVDETALEFLPDRRLLATVRFESGGCIFGSQLASTLITASAPPYEKWSSAVASNVTRLDSPNLVSYKGHIFAVGRYQPVVKRPFQYQGSALSRKRTALFLVSPEQLTHLTDLPSSGDTAYAGVMLHEEKLFVSYYSSPLYRDYPWLLGMLLPTSIHLASINLAGIDELCKL